MNRRNIILGLALAAIIALVAAVIARSLSAPPADRVLVAGDVRTVVRTIPAPAISYPSISYAVQVPSNAGQGAHVAAFNESGITGGQSLTSSRTAGAPVVSGTLTAVHVRVGDHVTTGAVLAQLDTTMLDLGVQQAKISAAKTKTAVRVLDNGIDTILSNLDKVATGRSQLATAKAQIAKAKALLRKAKAGLLAAQKQLLTAKKNRPQLEATLAALKAQAATFPPGHVPASLQAQIAKLAGLLASIDPGLAKIAAGLKALSAGQAKIAAGEAKLAAAAGQLATATDALNTAKKQVVKARDYVAILADSADVPIALAEVKHDQATVVSPVSGTVTQAAAKGTVAIVGAPLVRIAPDQPALVDTYVSGDQLASLHVGSLADITYDSGGGKVMHGTLETIGSTAQYPPTSFPTNIVHMTRTIKLTFRLDSGDMPPAGTPVDMAIHTN